MSEYKEVQIGPKTVEIPVEWDKVKVEGIFEIIKGQSYKSKYYADEEDGFIFINLKCINKKGGFNKEGIKFYQGPFAEKNFVEPGNLIMANTDLNRDAEVVGYPLYVPEFNNEKKIGISMDVSVLRKKNSCVIDKYFYYLFSNEIIHGAVQNFAEGSTVLHLDLDSVKNLTIPLPPLPEQRRIAEILSTVDDAIQKTDEVIEKAERLKKGLMQDLLTKGIGHDEFKEVQIGPRSIKIPKEWDIKNLQPSNGIVKKVTDGSHYSPPQIEEGEYLYATVTNFSDRGIDYGTCNKINEEEYLKMVEGGNKPLKGDVLFSKDGTIGITDVYEDDEDVVLLSSIAIIRPIQNQVNPIYLKYFLSSKEIEHQIRSFKSGTAIRRVVLRDIKKFKIPLPSLPEQRRIAEILSNIDSKIQKEKSYKQNLQKLKKGLMQDLLTGKVRVNT